MIWRAELDTGTVVLTEAPEFDEGKPYSRKVPDHRIVQYQLRDGSVMALMIPRRKDRRPLVAVIPLDFGGFGRLETARRLLSSLHGRKIPTDSRLTHQKKQRHARMLRALDGNRDGASQREIAASLFLVSSQRMEHMLRAVRHTTIAA